MHEKGLVVLALTTMGLILTACGVESLDSYGTGATAGSAAGGGAGTSSAGTGGAAGGSGGAGGAGTGGAAGGSGGAGAGGAGTGGTAGSGATGGMGGAGAGGAGAGGAGAGGAGGSAGSGGVGPAGAGGGGTGGAGGGAGGSGATGAGGSGATGAGGSGATGGSPACGISITRITANGHTEVRLAEGGTPVPASARVGRVVAGKATVLRVFVNPTTNTGPVTARLTLRQGASTKSLEDSKVSVSSSDPATLSSTFNFTLTPADVTAETTYAVELTQPTPCTSPDPLGRFPETGEQALEPFAGAPLRLRYVPMQVNGFLGVKDPVIVEHLASELPAVYPAVDLVSTDDPGPVDHGSWNSQGDQQELLDSCYTYWLSQQPSKDFFICMYRDADTVPGGVSGGIGALVENEEIAMYPEFASGTAYTAVKAYPWNKVPDQNKEWLKTTYVHELGHTFGAPHAPNGGAGGPDPKYPYPNGNIGAWGLDLRAPTVLKDPSTTYDLMGYAWDEPLWLSDFNYGRMAWRLDYVHKRPAPSAAFPLPRPWQLIRVSADGVARWGSRYESDRLPPGKPIELRVRRSRFETRTVVGYVQRLSDGGRFIVVPTDGTEDVDVDGVWLGRN